MEISMYLSIDTETTSIDGYMCELAALRYDECGKLLLEKVWALDPGCEIHPEAAKIHGYGLSKPIGTIKFANILEEYIELLQSCNYILVYSASFEWRVLLRECSRASIDPPIQKSKLVDVLALARRKLGLKSHKLADVVQYLGIPINGNFHGALADARYSAEIFFVISSDNFSKPENSSDKSSESKELQKNSKPDTPTLGVSTSDFVELATERLAPGLEASIPRMLQKVNSWKVDSPKNASGAISMMIKLNQSKYIIESARKEYLEPLKSIVSRVEKDVRTKILSPIESAIDNLNSKLDKYYTHYHDLVVADRISEVELAETESAEEAAIDSQSRPIVIKEGQYSISFEYTITVTDELLVPEMFRSPDLKLISRYVSANPTETIPGIDIKPKVRIK